MLLVLFLISRERGKGLTVAHPGVPRVAGDPDSVGGLGPAKDAGGCQGEGGGEDESGEMHGDGQRVVELLTLDQRRLRVWLWKCWCCGGYWR